MNYIQDRKIKHLSLTVATLTRNRPKMLNALLTSLHAMEKPENCSINIIVVENNELANEQKNIECWAQRFRGITLDYALETKLGISFGRNRAANCALDNNADLLIFVDDDEEVAVDWLKNLISGYRNSNALLMGGPLRVGPVLDGAGYIQNIIHGNIAARYLRNERRAAKKADLNQTDGVTIVTNNWLADVRIFKDHNIWFDDELHFSGGEDTRFFHDVIDRGLVTGWINNAYVYETIPLDRLDFNHQMKRSRDQSNTNFRRKLDKGSKHLVLLPFSLIFKSLTIFGIVILMPITGGRMLLSLARSLGWVAGRIGAILGHSSQYYSQTTGH